MFTIQVYATDDRDFIKEHRNFEQAPYQSESYFIAKDGQSLNNYIEELLNKENNQKIVIKKFDR